MPWFDCAARRPIANNLGGNLTPVGAILHHQAGNGSLWGWFGNSASRVSAHFWIAKNGTIEQYVDTSRVAWHGMSLNARYVGIETEGCPGGRDEPLTDAQISAFARVYAEGHRRHGWPNAAISRDGDRGLGFHRMAVNTACPCPARLNARPLILSRAFGGAPPPPPPQPPGQVPPMRADYLGMTHNSRHPDVLTWQTRMRDRGWRITADGDYGPQSDQVCRQFQREKRLTVDGLVGPVTWRATWTAAIT